MMFVVARILRFVATAVLFLPLSRLACLALGHKNYDGPWAHGGPKTWFDGMRTPLEDSQFSLAIFPEWGVEGLGGAKVSHCDRWQSSHPYHQIFIV